jgi:hypothetical protein
MKVVLALAILLAGSVAYGQVTANPQNISFGTMYPGQFDSQSVTYTCVTAPCLWASDKIGGHGITASDNTCEATWIEHGTVNGSTCSVTWTFLANTSEVNCPSDICTGTITLNTVAGGNGSSGGGGDATVNYTATVLSPKPTMTFSPSDLGFGNIIYGLGNVLTLPVTVTNVSNVDEDITLTEIGVGFGADGSACAPNLAPQQSCQITVYFSGYDWCTNSACGPETNHGVLKIWDSSTTPGTPSKSFYVGEVSLAGTSTPYIAPPPPPGAQVTASPTMVNFGTMYAGQFESQPVTYTCVVAPCVWSAEEITGHVVASDNTCKTTWKRGFTANGSTCSVTWTYLASTRDVNCPSSICTGSVGIKVVATEASGETVGTATSTYTATVLSPKPTLTFQPTEIDLSGNVGDIGNPATGFVTLTNVSQVDVDVSNLTVSPAGGPAYGFYASSQCPTSLAPTNSCQIEVFFQPNTSCGGGKSCTTTVTGSLKIWDESVTPGTPSTQYPVATIKLTGTSENNGVN